MSLWKAAKAVSMFCLCLGIASFSIPKILMAEDAIAAPPSETNSVVNLEGFSPADNITIENGVVKIGSTNVFESVTNTLVEQGIITTEPNSANAPDAQKTNGIQLTTDQSFQLNEAVNKVLEDIGSPRDIVNPDINNLRSTFQTSSPSNNSGINALINLQNMGDVAV